MGRILKVMLFSALSMGLVAAAQAQYGPPGGPYHPDRVGALVEKVNIDLNRGYNQWHLSNGDQKRLNKAEERLREFARDWNQARFNKGLLDASISDVQHVLDKNHLYGRERDALWNDVERLRNMREAYDRHEIGRW
jgi:hypothetical protein